MRRQFGHAGEIYIRSIEGDARNESVQAVSEGCAHRVVRSDVVMRAEGVSVGVSDSCHNSRSRNRFRVHLEACGRAPTLDRRSKRRT